PYRAFPGSPFAVAYRTKDQTIPGSEVTRIPPESGRASLHATTNSTARSPSGCSPPQSETSGPQRLQECSRPAVSQPAGLGWERADVSWAILLQRIWPRLNNPAGHKLG